MLRSAMATGDIEPGTVLSEGGIAAQLQVSRTPVREALRRLALEGFIERDERGRPVVHALTEGELREIFVVRELLEGLGARLAAARISDAELARLDTIVDLDRQACRAGDIAALARLNSEFHGLVMQASRNRILVELVDELQWRIFGLGVFAIGTRTDREHFVAEHAEMAELLRDGDPEGVESLVHAHLRAARDLLSAGLGDGRAQDEDLATTPHSGRRDRRDDGNILVA